jgi:hypothetical protein
MRKLVPITDLSAGELSRKLHARYDQQVYSKGLATELNFSPMSVGGATLRAGTKHMGTAATPASPAFLFPFVAGPGRGYLLEFQNLSMRVWRNRALVGGATFTTPWTSAMLRAIQVYQNERSLYFSHPDTRPRVLTWVSGDTFLSQGGAIPLMTFNGPGVAPGGSVAAWTTGTAYAKGEIVTRSGEYYYCLQAGNSASTPPSGTDYTEDDPFVDGTCLWRWYQSAPFYATADNTNNNPVCFTGYAGRLWALGTKNHPQRIWASQPFDYGNFFLYDIIGYSNQQLREPLMWYTGANSAGSVITPNNGAQPTVYLETGEVYYAKRINGLRSYKVSSWTSTDITLFDPLDAADVATANFWKISRWADPDSPEYETVEIYRDIVNPANAIELEPASDQNDDIQWGATGRALIVGGLSGEWLIPPDVSAVNVRATLQTRYGSSAGLQGIMVNDAIVFLQGGARTLREYYYDNVRDAYQSPDLTALADHILGSGAIEFDFAQVPEPMMFFVRPDGVLAVLLNNKATGARAWSRYAVAGGLVESVAVVPSDATGDDEIYVVVNRGGTRYIEVFEQTFSGFHMDSGVHVPVAGATVTGLSRLGATAALYDRSTGTLHEGLAVAAGVLTVPAAAVGHPVDVGLVVEGYLETLPIAAQPIDQSQAARIVAATFRVIDTAGFNVGDGYAEAAPITGVFTGDVRLPVPSDWGSRPTIKIRARGKPCTIIGIMAEVEAK